MKREQGFSLIELLVVFTIIGVIAALAIPNLRKARQYSEAASAVQSLRTITTAEHLFIKSYKRYGTLLELAPEGTIDPALGLGQKSGYSFILTVIPKVPPAPGVPGVEERFTCTATPLTLGPDFDHFFVDNSNVIRYETGAPANAASPPIPR
jgi:prepilin-type N-terminal cleavage/methylation domain-containing protein